MFKRLLLVLLMVLAVVAAPLSQVTVPNVFSTGTTIKSADVNTNFSTIANHALDRISGGNISGNVTMDALVTIDGIDLSVALCPSCATTHGSLTLSGLASVGTTLTVGGNTTLTNGNLTANGVGILASGKIPALTSTYFASLVASTLTALNATQLTSGTVPDAAFPATLPAASGANLTALNATNISSGTLATPRYTLTQTSALVGAQNNFALTTSVNVLYCTNATDVTFTGFAAGVNGQRLKVIALGAGNVLLTPQSGSSTAANRFLNFANVGNTPLAAATATVAGGTADFIYDTSVNFWRLVAHEQGSWITPTFVGGDFAGAGGWTVGSMTTMAYHLVGRSLTVTWASPFTTVVTGTGLTIATGQWGGFTVAKGSIGTLVYNDNGTGQAVGYSGVVAAATVITLSRPIPTTAWTSTANTSVNGTITFEVQ